MRFTELDVKGRVLIEIEARRGAREFGAAGLNPPIVQSNLGVTDRRDPNRGLHDRVALAVEAKVCRWTLGDGARRACAIAMTDDPAGKRSAGGLMSTASFGSDEQAP